MAINFNNLDQDRAGIIGLDNVVTQPSSAPLQTAFLGFGKSDEEKALEQIQELREDQMKGIPTVNDPKAQKEIIDNLQYTNPDKLKQYQEIEKQIEELKKQFPSDTTIQEASLPSNNLTAMNISNFDELFGTKTITDAFGNTRVVSGSQRPDIFTGKTDVATGLPVGQVPFDRILDSRLPGFQFSPKPTFGQRLSSGINQLKTNLGTGFGKIKSDIGSFIGSGGLTGMAGRALGGILQAVLPKESPIDKYNKQFSVQSLGRDPYGYYSSLRAGNLTGQDPFGVNTVSGFGNYQKHYSDYLNAFNNQTKFKGLYTPKKTSKFAQDKADFAKEVLGLKKTSSNITGTPLIVSGSVFEQDSGRDDGPKGGFSTERKGKEGAFGTFGEGKGRKDF
jgi:hypothetical protein